MDSQVTIAIVVVIVLLLVWSKSSAAAPATPTGITNTGYTGAAGTSGSSGSVQSGNLFDTSGTTFADTVCELYPDMNFTGWDAQGKSAAGQIMTSAAFGKMDINQKQVIIMSQRGGQKTWVYKSLKAKPGTILELTSYNSGNTNRAFIVVEQNIPDLASFLLSQNNLCCSNTGVYMQGWEHWDMDFKIMVIDVPQLQAEKQKRLHDCLATTQAWGYDTQKGNDFCAWDGVVGDQTSLGKGNQTSSS